MQWIRRPKATHPETKWEDFSDTTEGMDTVSCGTHVWVKGGLSMPHLM